MKLEDVLQTEYRQHYEQYRWIGEQQRTVITLYSAIATAIFILLGIFAKLELLNKLLFFSGAMIFILGLGGIYLSVCLVKSRAMQRRTAFYITELVIQLTEQSMKKSSALIPAIKFRGLTYTVGRFSLSDTINIATTMMFLFGSFLSLITTLVCGIYMLHGIFPPSVGETVLVIVVSLVGSILLGKFTIEHYWEKEKDKIQQAHTCIKNAESWQPEDLRKYYGFHD